MRLRPPPTPPPSDPKSRPLSRKARARACEGGGVVGGVRAAESAGAGKRRRVLAAVVIADLSDEKVVHPPTRIPHRCKCGPVDGPSRDGHGREGCGAVPSFTAQCKPAAGPQLFAVRGVCHRGRASHLLLEWLNRQEDRLRIRGRPCIFCMVGRGGVVDMGRGLTRHMGPLETSWQLVRLLEGNWRAR
eukprot:351641-Chlamydomonas_euryale.AAC.5